MNAILLAAGHGTRLRPLTLTVPKCLAPIAGRPLLDLWLSRLAEAGVGPFLVNTHYLAHQVAAHVAASRWRERVTLVHEEELLGTAGTLLANAAWVGNEPVMLVHADNLSVFDVSAFVAAHAARPVRCDMTMMLFRTDTPQSCGIVELDGEGVVVGFHEKVPHPPSDLANGAVYIVEPALVAELARREPPPADFSTQVIPHLLGRIFSYVNGTYHRDIGTPEALALANREYAGLAR